MRSIRLAQSVHSLESSMHVYNAAADRCWRTRSSIGTWIHSWKQSTVFFPPAGHTTSNPPVIVTQRFYGTSTYCSTYSAVSTDNRQQQSAFTQAQRLRRSDVQRTYHVLRRKQRGYKRHRRSPGAPQQPPDHQQRPTLPIVSYFNF